MTYLDILLVFVVLPSLVLVPAGVGSLLRLGKRGRLAVPILALIALVYTTPWDNYLIWRGVWDSPEDRILGRIGYVPVEEYLFFLLQPVLTGFWFAAVLRSGLAASALSGQGPPLAGGKVRVVGASIGLGVTLIGVWLLSTDATLYLGAILAWTAPVLTGMWWAMGDHLWTMRRSLALGVALPTLYLWLVDRVALAEGAWMISPSYTVGLNPLGLPIEEALFFLMTNMMVVLGMGLLLIPELQRRRS